MSSGEPAEPSGPSLRLVLGGLTVLAIILGVLAYWRYTESERYFAETLVEMDRKGTDLDTEGCVSAVLQWHRECEANKPLCDNGVPRIMTHCLAGQDRSSYCATLDYSSAKAQWVLEKCAERGEICRDKKQCPCANAYRAIDSFCRHDQEGVSL